MQLDYSNMVGSSPFPVAQVCCGGFYGGRHTARASDFSTVVKLIKRLSMAFALAISEHLLPAFQETRDIFGSWSNEKRHYQLCRMKWQQR